MACRYGAAHPRLRSLADVRRALGYFAGAKAGAAPAAPLPSSHRDTKCACCSAQAVNVGLCLRCFPGGLGKVYI